MADWISFRAPNISIKNITTNSFEIDIIPDNSEHAAKPSSYVLDVYCHSIYSGFKDIKGQENVRFPYKVTSKSTGEKFLVFVDAIFEEYNERTIGVEFVETIFVPITKIEFKEPKKLDIEIPTQQSFIFDEFCDNNIVITPTNASNSNFVDGGRRIVYKRTVDNTSCIDVDSNGYVKAKQRGIAKITVSKNDSRDLFPDIYAEVEVKQAVTDIISDSSYIKLRKGEQTNLPVYVEPENANIKDIQYTSDDDSIASVDLNTGLVTAKSNGTVTITCKSVDKPDEKAYIIIDVVESAEPFWSEIESVGEYLNSSDFNTIQGNAEYIYSKIKENGNSIEEMNFPRATNTTGFETIRTIIDLIFNNVRKMSSLSIEGFVPLRDIVSEYNELNTAPNNEMWNELLNSLRTMKTALNA